MDSRGETTVAVVLDPHFGDHVAALVQRVPVWICWSDDNERATRAVWAAPNSNETGFGATLFGHGESGEALLVSELATITLHHPDWQTLEAYGLAPTPPVERTLRDYGVTHFKPSATGFLATRPAPPP